MPVSTWEPLDSASLELDFSQPSAVCVPAPRDTIRALHVVNGELYAGAERVQDHLAARLPEFGVEVTFACVKPDRFPAARHSQQTPLVNTAMKSRFDVRPAWQLAKLIRRERFQIVHTHTPRAALVGQIAARLAGVPLVHHVHGHTAVEVGSGWRTWLSAKAEKFSLSGAAAVIAVSPTAAEYIQAWGVPKERIHLVANGVPQRDGFIDRPTPNTKWTLGTVAFFRPRKGLEVLLESVAELTRQNLPIQLHVIGGFESESYRQQAVGLTEKLGIADCVEWRGFCRNVDAELDQLDLLVLPSLLAEGMPMVVLEAMAAGVPPLGSRVDGITDVIAHGQTGLLFEPGSPAALADTVSSVIRGKHDWQQLRRNAVASHARKFSDRSMAAGVAEIYRTILESKHHD